MIVVEVDSSCKPHHLQELLLSIKDIGYDGNLAHFILVISSSRVTEGLPIGINQLRCATVVLDDLRDEYLRQLFAKCLHESKVNGVVNSVRELIGCRSTVALK